MDVEYDPTSNTLVSIDENPLVNPPGSTITFLSLNYTLHKQKCCNIVPLPFCQKKHQQILYDISGIFKPGMNAILGPTGSGKSSLLDILADRKDRNGLQGQILIDGMLKPDDFKYRVGYVVQDDIVSGTLTVRENLAFSANLRLPQNTTEEQKQAIVQLVIGQLGLEKCADARVGTEYSRGISGGERKRTNIGMELVLSPSVLFLDEPTTGRLIFSFHNRLYSLSSSGLDSSTASSVMEYLHQLSRRGRKKKKTKSSFFSNIFSITFSRNNYIFNSSTTLFDLQIIRYHLSRRCWPLCLSWSC